MNPAEELTRETIGSMSKSTSGVLGSTGMFGVDLRGRVSLIPINVPARNNTAAFPRVIAPEGDTLARWRAWLNINSAQASAAVGTDFAGTATLFAEQDVFAPYRPLAKFGRATLEAVAFGRNYDDVLADAELQTLMQLFIGQDMAIINHQGWALPAMGTVSLATATTGGSLAATTAYYVSVAARSGANYFEGGSGPSSAPVTITTGAGSTNSITATWAAVKGAVAYDVYFGSVSGAGNQWYAMTVTTGSATLTTNPGSAAAVSALPLISSLAPGIGCTPLTVPPVAGNGHNPSVDTSFSANYYNGIIASSLGDYGTLGPVTPGSGNATGCAFVDGGGAALSLSGGGINILDQLNDAIWTSVQLSPTAYMVNSLQGDEISKLIAGSNSATTFLPATDADARTNLAGGGFVGRYINRAAGGVPVSIEVHPRVAPGTIIARTDRVPFPGSNIGSAFEVRCQYELDALRLRGQLDSWRERWRPPLRLRDPVGGNPRQLCPVRTGHRSQRRITPSLDRGVSLRRRPSVGRARSFTERKVT